MAKKAETLEAVYREALETFEVQRSGPAWVDDIRRQALERLSQTGLPDPSKEAWRAVDLAPILDAPFVPAAKDDDGVRSLRKGASDPASCHLVFVNGHYSQRLSRMDGLPAGVVLRDLASSLGLYEELIKPYFGLGAAGEDDAFVSANTAGFRDGVFLYVPKGVEVEEAVHVWFVSGGAETPAVSYPRGLVILEEGSKASIVIHASGKGKYFSDQVIEAHVRPKAALSVTALHDTEEDGIEFLSLRCVLGSESLFDLTSAAFRGIIRHDVRVDLAGDWSYCSLKGLGVLGGDSRLYDHTVVRHASPSTTSRQLYKNILSGRSKADYSGLVRVDKGAQKADSNQLNRNLLLSDDVSAHSRPQLKIDADDIKATHGSSTGQLMDEELFYLRSRGLNEKAARSLLIYGFAEETIDGVEPLELRQEIEAVIRKELKKS